MRRGAWPRGGKVRLAGGQWGAAAAARPAPIGRRWARGPATGSKMRHRVRGSYASGLCGPVDGGEIGSVPGSAAELPAFACRRRGNGGRNVINCNANLIGRLATSRTRSNWTCFEILSCNVGQKLGNVNPEMLVRNSRLCCGNISCNKQSRRPP